MTAEGNRFTLNAEKAAKRDDENAIGVVAILGSTSLPPKARTANCTI